MCANVKNMDLWFGECEINNYYPLISFYVKIVIIGGGRKTQKDTKIHFFKNSDIPVPLQTDRKTKSSFNLFQNMWAHRYFSAVIRYTSTTSNFNPRNIMFLSKIVLFCLFVSGFSSHWEFCQSYGDFSIAGEVLHILSCAQRSWPLCIMY